MNDFANYIISANSLNFDNYNQLVCYQHLKENVKKYDFGNKQTKNLIRE